MSEDEAVTVTRFWKNQKTKVEGEGGREGESHVPHSLQIHHQLVKKSMWGQRLKQLSWRVDVKTKSRHIEQLNVPTGILEMKLGKEENDTVYPLSLLPPSHSHSRLPPFLPLPSLSLTLSLPFSLLPPFLPPPSLSLTLPSFLPPPSLSLTLSLPFSLSHSHSPSYPFSLLSLTLSLPSSPLPLFSPMMSSGSK